MNRLPAALQGVKVVAIDTSPFIYLIERHPQLAAPMRLIARALDAGHLRAVTSTITLTEVLVQPLRHGRLDLVQAYRDLLGVHPAIELRCIGLAEATRAAALRAQHGLKTPDALQLAVAIEHGCDVFLTNDRDLGRVTEIRVVQLGELIDE